VDAARIPGRSYAINTINDLSPEALGELRSWLEGSGFQVPISQIVGFSQYQAQYTLVGTEQAITSSTYADLSTAGPTITTLPAGKYLILFGAALEGQPSSNTVAYMSPSYNGSTPTDSDSIRQQGQYAIPSSRAVIATLRSAANTVKCQYRRDTSGPYNPSAAYRWLAVLKYSNA
jgi:hypothetical protein